MEGPAAGPLTLQDPRGSGIILNLGLWSMILSDPRVESSHISALKPRL